MITNDELATGVDVKTLLPIYKKMNWLIYNEDWQEIDTIFLCINIPRMSDVLLMGLLRLTLTWKDNIKSWLILYDEVKRHFDKRGVDILPEL